MQERRLAIAAVVTVAVLATAAATFLLARQGTERASPTAPTGALASPAAGTTAPFTPAADGPTASPDPQPTTPSEPPVEIGQVLDAGNLDAELVILYNRAELVNMTGWTLADTRGDAFRFPDLTLFLGGEVRLRSTSGTSGPAVVYWGRTSPAWGSGDLLTLRDADGELVDTYVVP
jgi:hypothetical protein